MQLERYFHRQGDRAFRTSITGNEKRFALQIEETAVTRRGMRGPRGRSVGPLVHERGSLRGKQEPGFLGECFLQCALTEMLLTEVFGASGKLLTL